MSDDLRAKLVQAYQKVVGEAETFLREEEESARIGCFAVVAHQFAVVLDDGEFSSALVIEGQTVRFNTVRGDACGTMFFTRKDASALAADWHARAAVCREVRVVRRGELVRGRKAAAERLLALLKQHEAPAL